MDRCGCAEVPTDNQIDVSALADVFERHAGDPGALIAVLQDTQAIYGYLPNEVLREISRVRQTPLSQVYGVATFYSQFHLRPQGETVIRICHGTACHVRGAPEVTRAVVEELGVKVGETTEDLAFTVESVACVGCCCLAPVMLVGSETYGQLDVVQTRRITASLREKADERRDASE
ncbi:MAG: NAD(P)H-dependent oxidoreductase subunit E [Actinomycetota bacterium]|nr:NAD(P)H-dependent oxidoreductase subunit E [Actinomycetota bacterium]